VLSINLAICWKAWISISHYRYNRLFKNFNDYSGENVLSAGNQQGRPDTNIGYYISGFVNGEGSFHVAIQ